MRPLRPNKKKRVVGHTSRIRESVAKTEITGMDRWLQRLANFSQPALLCLGIFGYFYTVVPVFQNQQLQEQTARLEIEKSASERQLALLKDQQTEVQQNINKLQRNWEQERHKNAKLAIEISKATNRELSARDQTEKIESTLQHQQRVLFTAQWELLLLDISMGRHFYAFNNLISYHNSKGEGGDFILAAEKFWPQPYQHLLLAVEMAATRGENRSQIPTAYYSEAKRFFEANQPALQCVKPDFSALHKVYLTEISDLNSSVESELDQRMNALRDEYAQKKQRVEISEEFRRRSRISIQLGKAYEVSKTYREKIDDLWKGCDGKSTLVLNELKKSKNMLR